MTVRARKFDPKVLISAPRRGAGIPNKDASYVLYSTSTYSFEDRVSKSEIRLLDVKNNESRVVDESVKSSEPVWLEGSTIAVLRSTDDGATELVIGNVKEFKNSCYVAGSIDASASSLKVVQLSPDHYGVALAAPTNPDGSPHNPQKMPKKLSSGRLYRSTFVRHWDKYVTTTKNAVWYGALMRHTALETSTSGKQYYLTKLINALKGTGLEAPIAPFGEGDHYDIGKYGITFVAKDIVSNPSTHTRCELYVVKLGNFLQTTSELINIRTPGLDGAKTSPMFSPDGNKLAVLVMREDGYEADKNRIVLVPDLRKPHSIRELLQSPDNQGRWNRSPASVQWSLDSSTLLLTAENHGRTLLWGLSAITDNSDQPLALTTKGSVIGCVPLEQGRIFVTGTSFVDNSLYTILEPNSDGVSVQEISSTSRSGSSLGLHEAQISDFWYKGAEGNQSENGKVHAWVIKPSDFDHKKKYPLALLVHGGPQGAWNDAWSTRWNAAVFAEQGYVVVSPNPTGSTGYGQDFTDAIKEEWGNLPFHDVVNCFQYVEKNLPYVDTNRAVALGASYGGYMMNWIQGQPFGRKFKALVTHNGIFSTAFSLATEELYFMNHDLGGPWSTNREKWLKYDPSRFTENWATPHLIIHSDLDFRLLIGDGLAAFNILQSQGIDSEFLNFPDENHFVLKPENSLVWHQTVLNFINKHVGLPPYDEDAVAGIFQG